MNELSDDHTPGTCLFLLPGLIDPHCEEHSCSIFFILILLCAVYRFQLVSCCCVSKLTRTYVYFSFSFSFPPNFIAFHPRPSVRCQYTSLFLFCCVYVSSLYFSERSLLHCFIQTITRRFPCHTWLLPKNNGYGLCRVLQHF